MNTASVQADLTAVLKLLEVPETKQPRTLVGMSSAALFELRMKMNELAVLKKENAELKQALADTILPG